MKCIFVEFDVQSQQLRQDKFLRAHHLLTFGRGFLINEIRFSSCPVPINKKVGKIICSPPHSCKRGFCLFSVCEHEFSGGKKVQEPRVLEAAR